MDDSPYTPPRSDLSTSESRAAMRGKRTALIGVVLSSCPIWGKIAAVVYVLRAFDTLAGSPDATPEMLAGEIDSALIFRTVGLLLGVLGAVFTLIALYSQKYRERWFYWWSIVLSIFWCLFMFPIGLAVGVPMAVMFIANRREFFRHSQGVQVSRDRQPIY